MCGSSAQVCGGVLSGRDPDYTDAAFPDGWAGIPDRCAVDGSRCAEVSHGRKTGRCRRMGCITGVFGGTGRVRNVGNGCRLFRANVRFFRTVVREVGTKCRRAAMAGEAFRPAVRFGGPCGCGFRTKRRGAAAAAEAAGHEVHEAGKAVVAEDGLAVEGEGGVLLVGFLFLEGGFESGEEWGVCHRTVVAGTIWSISCLTVRAAFSAQTAGSFPNMRGCSSGMRGGVLKYRSQAVSGRKTSCAAPNVTGRCGARCSRGEGGVIPGADQRRRRAGARSCPACARCTLQSAAVPPVRCRSRRGRRARECTAP